VRDRGRRMPPPQHCTLVAPEYRISVLYAIRQRVCGLDEELPLVTDYQFVAEHVHADITRAQRDARQRAGECASFRGVMSTNGARARLTQTRAPLDEAALVAECAAARSSNDCAWRSDGKTSSSRGRRKRTVVLAVVRVVLVFVVSSVLMAEN